jgi:hypothetical protein
VLDHLHLRRDVVELLVRLLANDVPKLPAARTGLLVFRQVMNDLLARQVRRQPTTAMAFAPTPRRLFLRRLRRGLLVRRHFRDGLVDQVLEQQPLMRIHLFRRPTVVATQQRLNLVLQVINLAIALFELFEELVSLGAKQLHFA